MTRQDDFQVHESWLTPSEPHKLFDVTCVIGSVYADNNGEHSPHVAAMMLIGEHTLTGIGGTFTFPMEDGHICTVTVDVHDAL